MNLNRREFAVGSVLLAASGRAAQAQKGDDYPPLDDVAVLWDAPRLYYREPFSVTGECAGFQIKPRKETNLRHEIIMFLEVRLSSVEQRTVIVGVDRQPPRIHKGDTVEVGGTLRRTTVTVTEEDGIARDAPYMDGEYVRAPESANEGKSPQVLAPTPRGDTLIANGWEMTVIDAVIIPDPPGTSLLYNIAVTLNVVNQHSEPRTFGKPDMDLKMMSAEGWAAQYDFFKTSSASVTMGEWSGMYSQGFDYAYTSVFVVWKHDPNLYQAGFTDWVLTITDGSDEYVLEIGTLVEP